RERDLAARPLAARPRGPRRPRRHHPARRPRRPDAAARDRGRHRARRRRAARQPRHHRQGRRAPERRQRDPLARDRLAGRPRRRPRRGAPRRRGGERRRRRPGGRGVLDAVDRLRRAAAGPARGAARRRPGAADRRRPRRRHPRRRGRAQRDAVRPQPDRRQPQPRGARRGRRLRRGHRRARRGGRGAGVTFWCEHAQLPDGVAARVRLVVEGGAIAAVERDADAEPGDERLAGLVLPGLANAHSHVFHRALRGRTRDDGGTFWTWRERMYAVAARLDPDRYLALARAAYAEMALAGTTAVGELHYLHHRPDGAPYDDPHAMAAALVQAAADAGVRLTLLDTCYLAGGLDATGSMPLAPEQRRFSDGDAERWAARHDGVRTLAGERVVVGAAIHSVRAVPAAALGTVVA